MLNSSLILCPRREETDDCAHLGSSLRNEHYTTSTAPECIHPFLFSVH